jgi:dTDP-4-dehydrorhamnose 3,5-epimerase
MNFQTFEIDGPVLIVPRRIGDSRGWFSETFVQARFDAEVGPTRFVQHNQSMSAARGTVRGLHFQRPPMAQGKLVRCMRGAILDVAVDLRRSSPSFGRHVSAELSADNGHQLWVPEGFAHGFVTLVDNTEIFYLVTEVYSAADDRGLLWNDVALGIDWGVDAAAAQLSDKDRAQPRLADLADVFA